jgi:hypothetical protein
VQLHAYADYLTRAAGLEPGVYGVTLPPFPSDRDVRTAHRDVVPDAGLLGDLGVAYVAAAFPIEAPALALEGVMDGVYVYRNREARPVVDAPPPGGIVLASGRLLFQYRAWPVHAGLAISGLTGLAAVVWLLATRRSREG